MGYSGRKWQTFQDLWERELKAGDFVVLLGDQNRSSRPGLVRSVGNVESANEYTAGDPFAIIVLARKEGSENDLKQHGDWTSLDFGYRHIGSMDADGGYNGTPITRRVVYPYYIRTQAEHLVLKVGKESLPADAVACLEEMAHAELKRIR